MKNNVRHSVGDKVVALGTGKSLQQPIIKDNHYTVKAIQYCLKCGLQMVNVGFSTNHRTNIDCDCGGSQPHNGLYWSGAYAFAPLTDASLQQAVEEENYELAVIIRDALHKTEKV